VVVFTKRIGIEKELFCINNGLSQNIRLIPKLSEFLIKENADFEYQQNVIEIRTKNNNEERKQEDAEMQLQRRIQSLYDIINESFIGTNLVSIGVYPGYDEPNIDRSQNEKEKGTNDFWLEFNLVFPDDSLTRWTLADQISISYNNISEEDKAKLYNKFVGLSPILVYGFSTSPFIGNVPLEIWCRRQQIINSKGARSGIILPETYPLKNMKQYKDSLEKIANKIEDNLKEKNPSFFCKNGKSPRDIVREYRGSDWGFLKLATDQIARFNLKGGWKNSYLELRCIDAQECTKMTVALAWLVSYLSKVDDSLLEKITSKKEEELKESIKQVVVFGDRGNIIVNGKEIPVSEASEFLASVIEKCNNKYSKLISYRLKNPLPLLIRKLCLRKDFINKLNYCLLKNKTINEIF